jgi:hypothetical protein
LFSARKSAKTSETKQTKNKTPKNTKTKTKKQKTHTGPNSLNPGVHLFLFWFLVFWFLDVLEGWQNKKNMAGPHSLLLLPP